VRVVRRCLARAHCAQGKFTIIKDCAKIEDNSIIAPGTIIPSFAIYSGSPGLPAFVTLRPGLTGRAGTYSGDLPDGAPESVESAAKSRYSKWTC
jgi:dynactin-5